METPKRGPLRGESGGALLVPFLRVMTFLVGAGLVVTALVLWLDTNASTTTTVTEVTKPNAVGQEPTTSKKSDSDIGKHYDRDHDD